MQYVKHLLIVSNVPGNHHLRWTLNLRHLMIIIHRTTHRYFYLTHSGRVTHIYASLHYASISAYNGLSPVRRQAITRTNAGLLSIGPLGINFSHNIMKKKVVFVWENGFQNVVCKTWQPFCLCFNVVVPSSRRIIGYMICHVKQWLRSYYLIMIRIATKSQSDCLLGKITSHTVSFTHWAPNKMAEVL